MELQSALLKVLIFCPLKLKVSNSTVPKHCVKRFSWMNLITPPVPNPALCPDTDCWTLQL